MSKQLEQACYDALNRVIKWRMVFCGWQLGTRVKGDPECDALRDHREVTILMRVELNALNRLLIENGIFTQDEYHAALAEEALLLDHAYEKRFPGMRSTENGMEFTQEAAETMKGWKP